MKMFKTGACNSYFEIPATQDNPQTFATWTKERLQNALRFADREDTAIVFCPWTNDLAMLEELDKTVFAKRPELTLIIDRRWKPPENFDAPENFFAASGAALPEQLAKMKQLRKLSLDFEPHSSIDTLGTMSELTSLYLDNNSKSKPPLSFLKLLTKLESLSLSGAYSDIETLGECRSLRQLTLTGNEFNYKLVKTEIPDWNIFAALDLESFCVNLAKTSAPLQLGKKLKKLVLANSNLEDLSAIEKCVSLEALLLHRLPAANLDFSALKNLETLSLERCKSLAVTGLKQTIALAYLQIYDCKMIPKKEIIALAKTLPGLKKLTGVDFVWDAPLEKAGLKHLIHNPNDKEAHEFLRYADRYNVY